MIVLLDTQVFIWWRGNDSKLGASARKVIVDAQTVFVSVVSAWEAAIKIGLGRMRLADKFEMGIEQSGFEKLSVTFDHAERVAKLPHHHRDPFDRMLVAQAQIEGLRLVSSDRRLGSYDIELIWA